MVPSPPHPPSGGRTTIRFLLYCLVAFTSPAKGRFLSGQCKCLKLHGFCTCMEITVPLSHCSQTHPRENTEITVEENETNLFRSCYSNLMYKVSMSATTSQLKKDLTDTCSACATGQYSCDACFHQQTDFTSVLCQAAVSWTATHFGPDVGNCIKSDLL